MSRRALVLLILTLLLAGPASNADRWQDARLLALERQTLALRHDLGRRPDETSSLARLRRDLRALQADPSERQPALDRLGRRLTDLRQDADRVRARHRLERSHAGFSGSVPRPDPYRPPWPEDLRGRDGVIGVGKLVVRIQRSLRGSAVWLDAGRPAVARRGLAGAQHLLDRLERTVGGGDPNIIALRSEASRLRTQLPD